MASTRFIFDKAACECSLAAIAAGHSIKPAVEGGWSTDELIAVASACFVALTARQNTMFAKDCLLPTDDPAGFYRTEFSIASTGSVPVVQRLGHASK